MTKDFLCAVILLCGIHQIEKTRTLCLSLVCLLWCCYFSESWILPVIL